jgi:hypothetical protein
MNTNKIQATLLDPQTAKPLAQISLDGEPIRANELISASGSLQGFTILSGNGELHEVWFDQQPVLLRTGNIQQLVKIATYPTDGENQGHLEIIPGTKEFCREEEERQSQPKHQIQRALALFQTLLGT